MIPLDDALRDRLAHNLSRHDRIALPLDGRRHAAVAVVVTVDAAAVTSAAAANLSSSARSPKMTIDSGPAVPATAAAGELSLVYTPVAGAAAGLPSGVIDPAGSRTFGTNVPPPASSTVSRSMERSVIVLCYVGVAARLFAGRGSAVWRAIWP